ncbi:GIY-YIG nuclease family protein [Alphaproteobacteria bacterium]|nr:GIY-YIG nuclease family protein [Alphaproteobacteria bacterium]
MTNIVYILINQALPNIMKIGITDNLERGMRKLDKTVTSLPFESCYVEEINDKSKVKFIEKKIHESFDDKKNFGIKLLKSMKEIKWAIPFRSVLVLYLWKWVDNGMLDIDLNKQGFLING